MSQHWSWTTVSWCTQSYFPPFCHCLLTVKSLSAERERDSFKLINLPEKKKLVPAARTHPLYHYIFIPKDNSTCLATVQQTMKEKQNKKFTISPPMTGESITLHYTGHDNNTGGRNSLRIKSVLESVRNTAWTWSTSGMFEMCFLISGHGSRPNTENSEDWSSWVAQQRSVHHLIWRSLVMPHPSVTWSWREQNWPVLSGREGWLSLSRLSIPVTITNHLGSWMQQEASGEIWV